LHRISWEFHEFSRFREFPEYSRFPGLWPPWVLNHPHGSTIIYVSLCSEITHRTEFTLKTAQRCTHKLKKIYNPENSFKIVGMSQKNQIFFLGTLLLRPPDGCKALQSLCLYVCLSACLCQKQHVQTSFYTCHLWPWLSFSLMTMQYVMHFPVYGRHHVFTSWHKCRYRPLANYSLWLARWRRGLSYRRLPCTANGKWRFCGKRCIRTITNLVGSQQCSWQRVWIISMYNNVLMDGQALF